MKYIFSFALLLTFSSWLYAPLDKESKELYDHLVALPKDILKEVVSYNDTFKKFGNEEWKKWITEEESDEQLEKRLKRIVGGCKDLLPFQRGKDYRMHSSDRKALVQFYVTSKWVYKDCFTSDINVQLSSPNENDEKCSIFSLTNVKFTLFALSPRLRCLGFVTNPSGMKFDTSENRLGLCLRDSDPCFSKDQIFRDSIALAVADDEKSIAVIFLDNFLHMYQKENGFLLFKEKYYIPNYDPTFKFISPYYNGSSIKIISLGFNKQGTKIGIYYENSKTSEFHFCKIPVGDLCKTNKIPERIIDRMSLLQYVLEQEEK